MSHTLQQTQKKHLTNLARKHKLDFVFLHGSQAREERVHCGTDLDLAFYRRSHPLSSQELLELYAQFSLIFSDQKLDLKSLHNKDPLFCYHVIKQCSNSWL